MKHPTDHDAQVYSESLARRIAGRLHKSPGQEGVYYVVRFPVRWQLVSHVWATMGDKWHRHVWSDYLAKEVAEAWGVDVKLLLPLWKAFPRGRVELAGAGEYTIYHGDDLEETGISKQRIVSAFELLNQKVNWVLDSHEQRDPAQVAKLKELIPL